MLRLIARKVQILALLVAGQRLVHTMLAFVMPGALWMQKISYPEVFKQLVTENGNAQGSSSDVQFRWTRSWCKGGGHWLTSLKMKSSRSTV